MGKVVGLIGAASGKIGNVVYAVTNGIQVARVYQPVVANPKTKGQREQRLKMSLAGRLSKITPSDAIIGMGDNGRIRRGAFIANIAKNATVSNVGGVDVAKVDLSAIKFSEGDIELNATEYGVTAARRAGNNHFIDVIMAQSTKTADAPVGYAEDIVAMFVDAETGSFDYVRMADRDWTAATTVSLRVADITRAYSVAVYVIPRALSQREAAFGSSYLGGSGADVLVKDLTSVRQSMDFGNSILLQTFTIPAVEV